MNFNRGKLIDARLRSPFTGVISGPTSSGKTQLVMRLITMRNQVSTASPVDVIYCYGEWQPMFNNVEGVKFHKGMIDTDTIPNDGMHRWLIIDDLMNEVSGKDVTNDVFTKGSHHKKISVFFIVQNLFVKNNRTVSLNSHYFFLMNNPRDKVSAKRLLLQAFPGKGKFLDEVIAKTMEIPYAHLIANFRQDTPQSLRLVSNYASDQMSAFEPL